MRLSEVTRPRTRVTADAVLRHAGYERLGKGAFGAVYEKPGLPYVLKVFSGTDGAYRDYLNLVMAHQDNPHFPKIKGRAVRVMPRVWAVRMERLAEYYGDPELIDIYMRRRDQAMRDDPPDLIDVYLRRWDRSMRDKVQMQWDDVMEFMSEFPKLKEACDLILDNLLPKHELDIAERNFMTRNGIIVITDPVKSAEYTKQEQLPYVPPKEPVRNGPKWGPEDDELLNQLLEK